MQRLSLESCYELISKSNDFENLRTVRDRVQETMLGHPLLQTPIKWNQVINELHDEMIRKSIRLAENKLVTLGLGAPPVSYAFVLFGSGGRSEQTLWSDQDNGLIYETPEEEAAESVQQYFNVLAKTIVEGLIVVGYPPCDGEVVATNISWCKPLKQWQKMMLDWFHEPHWEHVRYLLILADFRCIYGSSALADELKYQFLTYMKDHRAILQNMLHNTLHRKASLGIFGQLITERYGEDAGSMDIKYGSYIPIVNGVRLLAVQYGIRETSTIARIEALMKLQHISQEQGELWLQAIAVILNLRAITPFQLENGVYSSRGKLPASQLTKVLRHQLKLALHIGLDLQKYVKKQVLGELNISEKGEEDG